MTTITLTRPDLEKLLRIEDCFDAVTDAYKAVSDGRCVLPPVGYLDFASANGDCHIKYGHIQGDPTFVIKVATGFYDNPAQNLPSSNGIVLVLSAHTGQIEAILQDEGFLTDLRSGLGAAIATKALCRPNSKRVGIVGTGIQAGYQIRCLDNLMSEHALEFSVWGRSNDNMQQLSAKMQAHDIQIQMQPNLQELCENSDIILTTTPAKTPLVKSSWIKPGTHITASGADTPGKQELETDLVVRASLLALDKIDQCLDHGEVATAHALGVLPAENYVELGHVLAGTAPGRQHSSDITIADLTGLGSQDIAIAQVALGAYRQNRS